jgi:hypothetical protein
MLEGDVRLRPALCGVFDNGLDFGGGQLVLLSIDCDSAYFI